MVSIQAMKFAPVVQLKYLFDVQAKYLPTDASWTTATAAATNPNDLMYLFNPGEVSNTVASYDNPTWFTRKWVMLLNTLFTAWVVYSQSAALELNYFMNIPAKVCEDEEGNVIDCDQEEVVEEEPAEMEETPAEEENFF